METFRGVILLLPLLVSLTAAQGQNDVIVTSIECQQNTTMSCSRIINNIIMPIEDYVLDVSSHIYEAAKPQTECAN